MTAFAGYPATVFQTCWLTMQWLSGILTNGTASPASVASAAEVAYQTLSNGAEAVATQQMLSAWQFEFAGLQSIQALPLTLDAQTQNIFNARVATYAAAIPQIGALVPEPNPVKTTQLLAAGQPAIAYPGLIDYLCNFNIETPQIAFLPTTFLTAVGEVAQAWFEIFSNIQTVQGSNITQAYDAATRQFRVVNQIVGDISNFVSVPFASTAASGFLWNQICVVPSMAVTADVLMSAPYSAQNQQGGTIRFILRTLADKIALLLLSLRKPNFRVANTAVLLQGESLMDFASRTMGDFERWRDIAALNGLQPPYVAAVSGVAIATWGTSLLLPTTTGVPPASGLPSPSYAANVLGIDYNFGKAGWPVAQSMPPWNGDFQLAAGYDNLRLSLARRILTTRGSLIFHPTYGSRIPPEVGAVQTTETAGHISAYGKSALLSDPRVAAVISAATQIPPGGTGLVEFAASVRPVGLDQSPVLLNAVLNPLP